MDDKKNKKGLPCLGNAQLSVKPGIKFDLLREAINLDTNDGRVGYFRISREGKLLGLNHAMAKILGAPENNKLPKIQSSIKTILLNSVSLNEVVIGEETEIPLKESKINRVYLSAKSVVVNSNEHIIGFAESIPAKRENYKKLIDEDNLNLLIDSVDKLIWFVDGKGHLMAFNCLFEKYFQNRFKLKPEIGTPVFETLFAENELEWKTIFEEALKSNKQIRKSELTINGTNYFQNISINPVFDNKSKNIGVACVCQIAADQITTGNVLFESKFQLQKIINNIPYLIWLKDINGNIIVANQPYLNFFKVEVSDINISKEKEKGNVSEIFDYLSDDSNILSTGAKLTEEKSFNINGETKWFEIHKAPIYNDKLELLGVTGMARDITSRKNIENVMLESEEKFRQFAENTYDAFILCSTEVVLYVNPAFQKIFGRDLHEVYKHVHIPASWVHYDDRKKVTGYFNGEEYKKTGKFNGQYRVIKNDGTVSWVWERSFPVTDDKGRIIRYISVASDITRQKQLEVDLLRNKTQQQAILDNIPHMAWLKDVEGKYVSVNESFAKYYKHSKDELIGKTDSDFCHPNLAELYAYNDYIVIKTKKQQQFDEFIDTEDGTIYTETIKTPIVNDDGEVIGITGISRDITYYKRLEQQLRANDDRLKALLKNSTDSITVIDKNFKIIFDSSFILKIRGTKPEELNNPGFLEQICESDRSTVKKAIEKVIENPDTQQIAEFSCIKDDGSVVYFESFFSNHLKTPLIGGIVVNSRHITDRKLAELKEKEYQENLVFLEITALDFLSISSSEEIYDYIGSILLSLLPESVSILSTYDENENCLVIQNIKGVDKFQGIIEDLLGQNPMQYRAKLTDQTKRELFATSNKLRELNGGLYNIFNRQIDFMVCKALEKLVSLNKAYGMGIVRDDKLFGSIVILTRYDHEIKDKRIIETFIYQASIALQRRNLEKEFIAAKEKAEESDKLKTSFLANMSHEIRTPVNGIIGFSQLLEEKNLTEEKRREYIDIIKSNADALISLIDDILDVSIIQEGQVKLRKTTVNINLILDEIFTNYSSPQYKEKDIEFEIVKSLPDENATLLTDPVRIKQILNNLVSNAFKFTEKGKIEVGYIVEPDFIKFHIKDTGIGISDEKQESIFWRFTQGDSSYTRRFRGFGLGLAISRGLVEIMGGKIWVNSKPGEGSVFYFTIPFNDNSLKSPQSLVKSAKTNPSLLN